VTLAAGSRLSLGGGALRFAAVDPGARRRMRTADFHAKRRNNAYGGVT